jgi:hypothetical protein
MPNRKRYIVDRKFQLRTTFIIIAATSIVLSCFITISAVAVIISNSEMGKILEYEDKIIFFITQGPRGPDERLYKEAVKGIVEKHDGNVRNIKSHIVKNKTMLLISIFIAIAGEILLFQMLIRMTHRISGPIYVMSNYMKSVIDGKVPHFRELRKKDELKEFHSLFLKMMKNMDKNKS